MVTTVHIKTGGWLTIKQSLLSVNSKIGQTIS